MTDYIIQTHPKIIQRSRQMQLKKNFKIINRKVPQFLEQTPKVLPLDTVSNVLPIKSNHPNVTSVLYLTIVAY
jgi:hypothetical protein